MAKGFLYGLKLHTGEYIHAEGKSAEDAARKAGVKPVQVKRSMPVKWLDRPQMSEETKQKLRKQKQKEIC